ncbi:MAG: N-methyl-L-tryptophan oxidase [Planctomycetota bacterium]
MTATSTRFDTVVIGVGGVGSAALFHLARRGQRVLGIEQFDLPHDRGSSHGHTRVIRQAYFEHPDYVPLLLEAYRGWRLLEQETSSALLHPIGLLEVGPPQGEVIRGAQEAADRHGLALERLDAAEVSQRFPALSVPEGCVGVFEPAAGYLRVEDCVRECARAAQHHGAEIHTHETVLDWSPRKGGIRVQTDQASYDTQRLIITAGAWTARHVAGTDLEVRIKHLHWFPTHEPKFLPSHCPIFLYELPQGVFYGFPNIDQRGIKLAEHSGGAPLVDPDHRSQGVDDADLQRVTEFGREILGVPGAPTEHARCLYTMSRDHHFIVDLLSKTPNVAFVGGLSGHGFKFAVVLGRAVADLVTQQETELPIDFLSRQRFASSP